MNNTIENICYEYADDVLFSQDTNSVGYPKKIIIYLQEKFLIELSRFLKNYNYKVTQKKVMGRHFALITFCMTEQGAMQNRGLLEDF